MNYSLLLLVFFAVVPYIHGTISDLRLCADPECRGALSSGIATLRYSSIEPMVLSFNVGDEITIYSKDAGINRELWGAEIKGKRGYVPKRLIREMRVFIKTPTYQVPTELHLQPPSSQSAFNPQQPQQQQQPQQLLQPQQQQQPPQQQQQQPQQPQLYQQPLQQGGPQGNFIPHQQQPMAPNVNPQFQNNNQLPNQPIPMQHTPPLQQQQPKPMMQQPAPPITTTGTVPLTTETQLPSEIMETDAEKPLPIQAKLLSFKEPPAPVLPLETSLNPEKVGEGKEVEEESEDEEEEDGDDELDENESEDSADNEESNDRNSIVEDVVKVSLESKDEETQLEKEKDSNAGPVDLPSMDSLSEDTFQTKTPNIDPIIDIGDLAGVDSSAINSLHIRSIEDKIENPISINKEPINSSSIADVPISITSSETIKTEALPTNQVVEEALLIDQETVENTTTEDSSLPGDPVIAIEKESIDIQAKEVVVDSATEDVESKLMFTEETVRVDQPVEVIDQQPPMEMLNPPSASEPIQSQVISSTSSESVAISDPVVENQQPVESHVDKGEAQETVLLEEPPTEPPQTEVVSQESVAGSSSDVNLSSSDVEKSSDETKTPGSDGSGGGFLDSALNWLGLSDTDEPLKTEQVDVESTDPAPLQQQIAAMNPSDQDSHQQQPTIPSVLDGFCDTQDCPKLVESTATESILVDSHNHHADDQHHHHVNDGHNHHHDNDGHGHHHHHHHHDDTGFGHGHSHIPGYIPGFRHHYKPPVAQAQVAPPAELPPVELAAPATEKIAEEPVAHQPAEQLISPPVAENLNPLPTATEQLDQSNPIVEQAIPRPVGPLPSEVSVQESVASTVPEYIPVEEIFRAEMEKNRLLHEQQLKAEKETNLFDWLSSTISSLSEGKLDSGSGSPANLYLALLMSVTMVAFLTLYYAVTSKSGEKILKAKISLLDKQLYESQTAKEETTSIQSKLTEYETNAAELRSLKEQADAEKASLSKRIATLEKERDLLEKEVEAATETATEANRMFEELLSSQSENDQWQRSVEVLQQQLNKQQQTMENLNSSLCVKTAENETLNVEVEELRTESERYKVRIKTLQSDLETLKTSNRNYQQKMAQDSADLMKLKQEKESWVTERRAMSSQINRHSKEVEEWRDKTEQLKKSIKAKESDLAKSLQLLKESGNDSQTVLQLTSLVQLESQLSEANETVEKLRQQVQTHQEEFQRFQEEKAALQLRVSELKASGEAAAKQKHEAETRLEVLSNYFKEKETQLQKELGTHEAKRAITEENVSESVKRILETEESLIQYKSQVETLTKEIEEQERSYKSRLATQEKRAHENWVAARQLERRLEETKQEAAQLRHRLTQVEKDKEALLVAKENGTANGVVDVDLIKPVIKRPVLGIGVSNNEDLTMMEHPPLLSPPIPPPPGMELGLGGPPPPGMPFDSLFPPPHFIPPAPFMPPDAGMLPPMHLMPSIPPPPSGMLADHHRPPPLGMIATGSFDVDYRRELSDPPPPRRYPSPPRRYPSPLGSERSVRSDRSDRMDRYDDHFRPVSPYGRHGGRPRSVGRSRDVSPERPRSYSPLPSPLYPPHTTIHSPEDWDDGRNYNRAPMMRSGSLRHPPSGPKTSSPLIQPLDNGDRHRPQPH